MWVVDLERPYSSITLHIFTFGFMYVMLLMCKIMELKITLGFSIMKERNQMQTHQPHDKFFKETFSDLELTRDFIRHY